MTITRIPAPLSAPQPTAVPQPHATLTAPGAAQVVQGSPAQGGATDAFQRIAENDKARAINGCETCRNRTYVDSSNDPGVSFKSPTKVAPEAAASAVRSHENEHVFKANAKAQVEGREVVSQTVTLHTSVCPECGQTYVSGGTTRTTTRSASRNDIGKYAPNDAVSARGSKLSMWT